MPAQRIVFRNLIRLLLIGFFGCVAPGAAAHGALSGAAVTVTGDTLEVQGTRVRLFGVTAPALEQRCEGARARWRCGMVAKLELEQRIGKSEVICLELGRDVEGRVRGRCQIDGGDGVELNRWLVVSGWALASEEHGQPYKALEKQAEQAGAGLWRGGFRPSGDWRRIAENAERGPGESALDCSSCTLRHGRLGRARGGAQGEKVKE